MMANGEMSIDQNPQRKRFRPILRMNDLLHPIQQRERMYAFSSPGKVESAYSDYARIWAPKQFAALLSVKVPNTSKWLDEETYLVLLQQRVNWMMQCWMQDLYGTQSELEKLLRDAIAPFHSNEPDAIADFVDEDIHLPPLKQWRNEWAERLIRDSDRILELIEANIQFPLQTWDSSHPNFHELHELHEATDLETWLSFLTQ